MWSEGILPGTNNAGYALVSILKNPDRVRLEVRGADGTRLEHVEYAVAGIPTAVISVDKESGVDASNDAQQYRTLGLMCLIYGGFVFLLVLIPNPLIGRLSMMFCSGSLLAVGGLLYLNYLRTRSKATVLLPPKQENSKGS